MSPGACLPAVRALPAKRIPSVGSVRSANPATAELEKPSRLRTPKPQPINGIAVFDPAAFLARAVLGRKIITLKKNETAYAQGDPADAIFYVRKGQLRSTIISASGKEATIALVGTREFLGEDCKTFIAIGPEIEAWIRFAQAHQRPAVMAARIAEHQDVLRSFQKAAVEQRAHLTRCLRRKPLAVKRRQ